MTKETQRLGLNVLFLLAMFAIIVLKGGNLDIYTLWNLVPLLVSYLLLSHAIKTNKSICTAWAFATASLFVLFGLHLTELASLLLTPFAALLAGSTSYYTNKHHSVA